MKATDQFKTDIKAYLDNRAANDQLFSVSYAKEGKNIDDCITYILNTVKKSGCNGFADDEIFGMAVHYYDEDQIEVGKPIDCKVVVNHTVELTKEEIQQAKEQAIAQVVKEQTEKMTWKPIKKKADPQVEQPSLFE